MFRRIVEKEARRGVKMSLHLNLSAMRRLDFPSFAPPSGHLEMLARWRFGAGENASGHAHAHARRYSFTYEDLAAFQYPDAAAVGDLDVSLHAWQRFMGGWGVAHYAADPEKPRRVHECLAPSFGTHHRPQPHSELIENYKEAEPVLTRLGWGAYLRRSVAARQK